MLTDPEEIRIIANARQKNVADPKRSRVHFERILEDFFHNVDFSHKNILDLGPGQYDFGELAKSRGALTHGFDNDPCVLELGEYKGFHSIQGNLKTIQSEAFDFAFDGLFCKYSINAFWFYDQIDALEKHLAEVISLIVHGGWAWLAPWNGIPKKANLTEKEIASILNVQRCIFKDAGFVGIELSEELSKYYGVHGVTADRALFLLNLPIPQRAFSCPKF